MFYRHGIVIFSTHNLEFFPVSIAALRISVRREGGCSACFEGDRRLFVLFFVSSLFFHCIVNFLVCTGAIFDEVPERSGWHICRAPRSPSVAAGMWTQYGRHEVAV